MTEIFFTRDHSVSRIISRWVNKTETSIEAALYRLNDPRLAASLAGAVRRGVAVRLILDRNKFDETPATRQIVARNRLPFRLLYGRNGPGSKMHHKFAILDGHTVLTGSYNWTLESEEDNFDHLLVLHEPGAVAAYRKEFEMLWVAAKPKRIASPRQR